MNARNTDERMIVTEDPAAGSDDLVIPSPIGALTLHAARGALVTVHFCGGEGDNGGQHCGGAPADEGVAEPVAPAETVLGAAAEQFAAYFLGELRELTVPIRPSGTPFQLAVWEFLRTIPYGETVSYGEVAARLGRPSAARAVGRANALNPLPVIVPCHRVVGADGTLIGYAGGLARKRTLLALEARNDFRPRPSCGLPAPGV